MRDGGGKKGRRGGTALQPRRRGGVPARPLGRREQRPEAAAAAELGGRARHRRCAASEAGGGGGRASQGECAPARGRRHGNGGAPRAAACGAGGSGRATVIARPLASRLLSQATATAAVLCGRSCLACPVPSRVPVLVTGAGKGYAEFVPASGASGGGKAPKTGRRLEGDVASVADVRPLLEKSNIFIRVCIYLIAVKLLWSSLPGESPCKVSSGSCNANALCFDFRVHPIKY